MKNYRKLLLPALAILPLVLYSFKANSGNESTYQIKTAKVYESLKTYEALGSDVAQSSISVNTKKSKWDGPNANETLSSSSWAESKVALGSMYATEMDINQVIASYK
ncbi:hypothetical protein C1637_03470 [Chryseobacterium lactis]|uniref:Uncharacterized protein n=1 Tax=Chryseobacterium lactis TaxID=1241981 RepID=A0A3G6RS23_CHRLC|nr:hypothetical protein [Chryseobacterium lactis]AZA81645.1 hypothetical protein EG342_06865 [Chryseobacterium lactis]AZB06643.1 hypothetical protein EG341_22985 [Chryseobacterium lactis]PNW15494.1 hypothetical protein C1637_03470 [Chryseobacterium lactis]